jgi:von Willebrand factor A domain-containing protein 5
MNSNMGGTEIEIPLRKILKSKVIPGYPKQIFLLTDGEVNNTEAVIDIVRKNIKYSRVHAIGLGDGASAALIRGCA